VIELDGEEKMPVNLSGGMKSVSASAGDHPPALVCSFTMSPRPVSI
jgi:hypothetical protein